LDSFKREGGLMPQRGDVVLYSENGKTYNAIVLMAHGLNDSHLGALLEPQLHLVVLFDDPANAFMPYPAKKGTLKPGFIPETSVVYDVVHASHAFSQAYLQSHGLRNLVDGDPHRASAEAEIRNRRGAGEWREPSSALSAALDAATDYITHLEKQLAQFCAPQSNPDPQE
jgi:hypothetical protein